MKAFWISFFLLGSIVVAQDIPPLAPLRGDAANLKDTIKFIQEKLPGTVNYMVYGHDNITGTDAPPLKRSFVVSDVTADTSRCSINFHDRFDSGKNTGIVEHDVEILLKQVKEVVLMQMETVIQQANAKAGYPERSAKVDPPIALVEVRANRSTMF